MSSASDAHVRLIEAATEVLGRNFDPDRHIVGAAVLASGEVYTGVNLEACGYGPCAEPVALGAAITAGERAVEAIVAVGKTDAGEYAVLSPCGNCRQLLLDYCPDAVVVMPGEHGPRAVRVRDLLPTPYVSGFGVDARGAPRREESERGRR